MKKHTAWILMIVFACFVHAQAQIHPIAEGVKVYQNLFYKSMNDSVACYRIPSIVTAPNGDLVVAIDERVPSCGDLKWAKTSISL
ncbi:MAG: sialidase family protein [Bacteroidia bacterium]